MSELEEVIIMALQDKKLRKTLERIVKKESELRQKYPTQSSWWDWEIGDIGVEPWHVLKLVRMGIVERTYASRSHKYYRLVDYELTRQLLSKPTKHLKKRLDTIMEDKNLCKPVPKSYEELFDVVVGYDDYKWLVWKALKKWERGHKPAHFLLTGPPATGKTIFVECIEKKIGCCVYVAAESARRGGFVERILDAYNTYGRKFILIVDELDKMDSEAMKILHNLMEYRLNITVHGKMIDDDKMRVMIIATTNQLHRVPEAIRSRFGNPLHFTYYDREQYIEVVKRVLTTFEGVSKELAEYIAVKTADMGIRDPRAARQIAQSVDTKEEVDKAIKILFKNKKFFTKKH